MQSERSRRALNIHDFVPANVLQARVKGFIYRQQSKAEPLESPNFKMNKSSDNLSTRTQLNTIEDSTADLSNETIKTSKSSLKDLKRFQEILKAQLHENNSYTNAMILRKVNQKAEEVKTQAKLLEAKSQKLLKIESRVNESLKKMLGKEKNVDSFREDSSFEAKNSVKKKICFDELLDCQVLEAPVGDFQGKSLRNQLELSRFESELRLKSQELSRIAENLKIQEKNICKEKIEWKRQEKELKIRENHLEARENALQQKITESFCRKIIETAVFNANDIILAKEKQRLCMFNDRLLRDFTELSENEKRFLENNSKTQLKLSKKAEFLENEETRILSEVKLLSKANSDKLIQLKLEDIAKKEAKLRSKQVELREFKHLLKDREEELCEKEAALRYQYSTMYHESSIFDRDSEISKRKSELEQFKESLLIDWISSRNSEEPSNDKRKDSGILKLFQRDSEGGKINSSLLDGLLFDSIR